jgi:GH15 family glucan-1,4-alpha-glucosidase
MGPVKDEMIWRNALDQMQRLKMPSGGYRRVTSTVKDPQIFEYWYERQEFVFINFLMAEVYLKLGMPDKAAELIKPMLDKASEDHFFVPEMYVSEVNYRFTGPVGAPTGAIPMVGYGAGAYAIYLLQRENAHK